MTYIIPSGYLSQRPTVTNQCNRYWEKYLSSDSEDEAVSAVTIALPLKKRARLDTGLREGSESPELICLDDDDD